MPGNPEFHALCWPDFSGGFFQGLTGLRNLSLLLAGEFGADFDLSKHMKKGATN